MKGINNIGNSCYLNSALQMIMQNTDLCELIIKYSQYSDKLNIIKNFILNYHNNVDTSVCPSSIKSLIDNRQDIFKGNLQHDSTECIIFLYDIIDSEIKQLSTSNEFNSLFNIEFNNKIKCKRKKCLYIKNYISNDNLLLLNIDNESKTLDDLFNKNFMKELLNDIICIYVIVVIN